MSKRHAALNRKRWSRVRRAAFERDGWRCTKCDTAGRLEAHHEPPLDAGADPYELAGIRTLCRACHIELHQAEADDTPGRDGWRAFVREIG